MSGQIKFESGPSHTAAQTSPPVIRASNDNGSADDDCVTDIGAAPYPSITPLELEVLGPLIKELALMAANDLSATTFCSEER